jgi:hypothetical protein
MGKGRKLYKVLVESPKERDHLEDQGIGGWDQNGSYGDWLGGVLIGFDWLRIGTGGEQL